ncbi:MAG: sigma-70 family RNA polymerase sigma factor [Calothrix sp. MO_167.B42]|nr:sigma-70 family RNA polymerase sigma factor [Calothrix sp. MO_167.B42]
MTTATVSIRGHLRNNALIESDSSYLVSKFWQRWQENRDQLYRCCLKMMNYNRADAEDALSRAMLKAWSKVQKFEGKIANFKAWLYQVTRNLCIDIIRERSRGAAGVESLEWVGNTEEMNTAAAVECPESVLEREEKSAEIRKAIAELPEKWRETFILHFDQELSYKEIAEQQGISYQSVCKRISLARKKLKQSLSPYFRGSESEVSTTVSVESQSPTPQENGEKQQTIEQDEQNILETEAVSAESDIANIQPFPNNNAIFSCHSTTPLQLEVAKVEKSESVSNLEELKARVGLNITDVVNISKNSPILSRLSIFWQSLMQGVGWKTPAGAAITRYWNSCARGLFYFCQELPHPGFIAGNSWTNYKLFDTYCVFPGFDTG